VKEEMSYTIGDGMVTFALAGSIVGYLYMKHQSRQKRIEIIHQERMAAMEKGIPLPEFPLEPPRGFDFGPGVYSGSGRRSARGVS
jgi:hypothetical protein